jgi:glucokinase
MRIAIEIGGTKLQVALGDGLGLIHKIERAPADAAGGADAIRRQIVDLVKTVSVGEEIDRIGIGFGGPVDVDTGCIVKSHQVEGWSGFALRDWSETTLGATTVVENDSNCAGLAEALRGAGQGAYTVFYMNVGSGIGGAFVQNGKLYTTNIGAGEIGHTSVWNVRDDRYDTLESQCSGWAIAQKAQRIVAAGRKTIMLDLADGRVEAIDGRVVGHALAAKDEAAVELIQSICGTLAVGLANMIALLNPERVVIGGGVALMGEPFLAILREALARRVFAPYRDRYALLPAQLGEEVVLLGALLL